MTKQTEVTIITTKTAQEYLNFYYPKEERSNIKELNISKKNLTGSLDCSDFINLEKLNCSQNQLTNLNLTGCVKLKELDCSNNNITNLPIIEDEENPKLEKIICSSNEFTTLTINNQDC